MREFLDDIFKHNPLDPTEAAQLAARPALRRRFYERVSISDDNALLLDGRPVRTPARNELRLPTRALADAVKAEWEAQVEQIDPARMPLTRLANTVIDGVTAHRGPVADDVSKYLGADLLFYRADQPAGLVARQERHWDPVLAWAREALGARFVLAEGVVFAQQPAQALESARAAIPGDPWRLAAVHSMMTLTGSALLALAVLRKGLTAEQAWAAAHVDEDWNMDLWGQDELALDRRAFRFAEMQAAARMLALL